METEAAIYSSDSFAQFLKTILFSCY